MSTSAATTTAVAQILGRRVEQLTAVIRAAIPMLESDEEFRASGSVQGVIDELREAVEEWCAEPRVVAEDELWEDPDLVRAKVHSFVHSGRLDYTVLERKADGRWQFLPGVVSTAPTGLEVADAPPAP